MSDMNGYGGYFYKYIFRNFIFGEAPNGYFFGNRSRYINVSTTVPNFDGVGVNYPTDPAYDEISDRGSDLFGIVPVSGTPSPSDTHSIVFNSVALYWPIATEDWDAIWAIVVSHVFSTNPDYGNPSGKYPLFGGRLDAPAIVKTGDQLICLSGDFSFQYNW